MIHFASPWAFILLPVIPALLLAGRRRTGGSLRFSSTVHAKQAGPSLRFRLRAVPILLRALALVLLVVALARPQIGTERVRESSNGIAIEMVLDRSGSMGAEMAFGGERITRLDVVKKVFGEFVNGGAKGLAGRPGDLIGMVAFAHYPDTVCPLTLAHGALSRFLDTVQVAKRREEDGTAIGDAIALSAARLKTAEETLARQIKEGRKDYVIKSKAMILLTDGQNNCGRRRVNEAAELAAKWGIRIYAIAIGGGESVATVRTPFGDYKVPSNDRVDEAALQEVAKITGGICRLAEDVDGLRAVCAEIDKLERTEIESVRYLDYREMFVPFALAALVTLLCEAALSCTVFRKIP